MALSDAKLGAIIRKALAEEGHIIKPMPKAKKPWHFDSERWDRQSAKHSGITVERLQGRRAWMQGKPQLEPQDDDGTAECAQWMLGWQEMQDVCDQFVSGARCQGSNDGDCYWVNCPNNRDGEAHKTGRHCPLDRENMRLEELEA
jgi:hypothetical protein